MMSSEEGKGRQRRRPEPDSEAEGSSCSPEGWGGPCIAVPGAAVNFAPGGQAWVPPM